MELRPYQQEAIEAVYRHLRERDDNPCVVSPTGSGKGILIGRIAADVVERWNGRILVLTHVKELVDQNATQAGRFLSPLLVGVHSAGLKRRDFDHPVIVAGIQSVYQKARELGRFDVVLVDEVHLVAVDGEGMYRSFLSEAKVLNPHLRLIGLTATPFRLKDGPICAPENLFNHICYEIGVKELIQSGYLSPLIAKAGRAKVEMANLHVRGGEFIASEVETLMDQDDLVSVACAEIVERTKERRGVLIFAAGVQHGQHVARSLHQAHGLEVGEVYAETPSADRDRLVSRFRSGDLRYLVNVTVLTTGFDAPAVDCVVLLRPTLSAGLYAQMLGRGFRLAPGKADCLVLDFAGNVLRHGPVDALRVKSEGSGNGEAPAKECPSCQELIAAGFRRCPQCGHEFPQPQREQHERTAGNAGVLTGQISDTEYRVRQVLYSIHSKRGADESAPKTLRVEYEIDWRRHHSEWICLEHTGWARQKAEQWWGRRSHAPVPRTVAEAVALAVAGALCPTSAITVRSVAGEPYDRIVDYTLGEKPPWRQMGDVDEPQFESYASTLSEDEVPF